MVKLIFFLITFFTQASFAARLSVPDNFNCDSRGQINDYVENVFIFNFVTPGIINVHNVGTQESELCEYQTLYPLIRNDIEKVFEFAVDCKGRTKHDRLLFLFDVDEKIIFHPELGEIAKLSCKALKRPAPQWPY